MTYHLIERGPGRSMNCWVEVMIAAGSWICPMSLTVMVSETDRSTELSACICTEEGKQGPHGAVSHTLGLNPRTCVVNLSSPHIYTNTFYSYCRKFWCTLTTAFVREATSCVASRRWWDDEGSIVMISEQRRKVWKPWWLLTRTIRD